MWTILTEMPLLYSWGMVEKEAHSLIIATITFLYSKVTELLQLD
jgi:hypothetical protein